MQLASIDCHLPATKARQREFPERRHPCRHASPRRATPFAHYGQWSEVSYSIQRLELYSHRRWGLVLRQSVALVMHGMKAVSRVPHLNNVYILFVLAFCIWEPVQRLPCAGTVSLDQLKKTWDNPCVLVIHKAQPAGYARSKNVQLYR